MKKTHYNISITGNLRIALVTDLHQHDPSPVISLLKEEKPDIIAVAGDTFERHEPGETHDPFDDSLVSRVLCLCIDTINKLECKLDIEKKWISKNAEEFLRQAVTIAPVIMSLGNHEIDFSDEDRKLVKELGVHLLENEIYETDGICFGGLNSRQKTGCLDKQFFSEFSQKEGYKILLCHHPEYYPELKKYDIDLFLAGHCHGGQIRILGRGLFGPGQGFFPRYHHGFYDGRLVVSSGCSNTTIIPRLGNPREVVFLTSNGKER